MMVQNEHRNGTAPPGVEARDHAERTANPLGRHVGAGRAFEAWQIVEVIVDRLERARRGVAQHFVEPPLRLARVERDAEVERFVQRIGPLRQHRKTAGNMESADNHRYPRGPQGTGAVHHARELVRLHADEADHAKAAIVLNLTDDMVRPDAGVGLVDRKDLDRDVLAKDLIFHAFLRDAEQAGERIGGQRRLPPLDDVALVVVMRRLDKEKQKTSACGDIRHPGSPRNYSPPNSCPAFAAIGDADRYQSSPGCAIAGVGRVLSLQRATVTRR